MESNKVQDKDEDGIAQVKELGDIDDNRDANDDDVCQLKRIESINFIFLL